MPLSLTASEGRGATRLLTITELKRVGDRLDPTGVVFRFSRENFAAPRGQQQFGVQQRTVRKDLPGSEEPVEQVLGWNYTEFSVSGVWDDRYAGVGFAERTRKDFEELVKRGNPVRYQFEQVSVVGILKNLTINYRRQDQQGYSFTISPHNRSLDETVREDANPERRVVTDPKQAVERARAGMDQTKREQDLARAQNQAQVQQLLRSDIFSEIGSLLDEANTAVASAEDAVNNRILKPGENVVAALNGGAQSMRGVVTASSKILSKTRQISSGAQLASTDLVTTLQFENWHRRLSASVRGQVVTSEASRREFEVRANAKPKRLHRVKAGESLYQISQRYYSTPHHWREILQTNHLSSLVLFGGELLEIPDLRV